MLKIFHGTEIFPTSTKDVIFMHYCICKVSIGKNGAQIKGKFQFFLEFHWKKTCILLNQSSTAILSNDKIK